ncbi:BTB/POZ domain-containing protein 6-A-like [Mercenaria mercenaria]|uniref:BTB/POZ domain-containing protein 6-A-like n=1 Tax=Mercenaria mercenaria TaxID=6596 RepID=UPI00234F692C|nr:BTB/POZ domain-containing protein 6-A-like [Mercenaria mercenaria]
MSTRQQSFLTRQRGNSKGIFRRTSRPTSNKSAPSSDKSVSFNFNHDWQSGKSLAECNKQMLKASFLTDVISTLKTEKKEKSSRRTNSSPASRSSVFFSKLCGSHNSENVFTVGDIEPKIFNKLLGYIYTDEVDLTTKTVLPLLYAAKKYKLQGLVTKCCEKLTADIDTESVCTLLEQAHEYKEVELEKHCLQYIFKNAHAVLQTASFQNLCGACLKKIIHSDDLKADESKIYEAVCHWSAKECKRQKLSPTPDNRSRVLGKLIYFVRFPLLDLEYFAENVPPQGLLTKDEITQILRYFHSRTSPSVGPFISRRRALTRVVRFETTSGAWNVGNYIFDSIRFQSSRDITLHGVVVYGCFTGMSEYDVAVRILNNKQEIIAQNNLIIESNADIEMCDILLSNAIRLDAMTWYTIMLNMEGPQTKRGVCGKEMVYYEQVQFMFKNSSFPQNCTSEREGQIPGILFH